jgi:hypothetical protein
MKLNMKVMAAVALAASTLGGNAYAAPFNFAGFTASLGLPPSAIASNPSLSAVQATVTAVAAAQSANAAQVAQQQTVVQTQQASAGISGS